MGHMVQRLGIKVGRGWILFFAVVLAVLLAAWWIDPLRTAPPEVELLAEQDGQLVTALAVAGEVYEAENVIRFPLQLYAQNVGTRPAEPRRVVLSVPGRYRVVGPRGRVAVEVTPGVALRRYVIDVQPVMLGVGGAPQPLPGLEQIWLEPDLPRYYCTTRGDVIPEFIPAPALDPTTISDVRIFYSVHMRNVEGRSTGTLAVRVDPSRLTVTPAPMPAVFPAADAASEEMPDLGRLQFRGTRTAWCGDPDQPMELYTAMWEGDGGSRVYSIHVAGLPRKRLYDLDGDGIIDLETWDVDGDGHFDARREARFETPELLIPLPPRNPQLREPITTPPDPQWLAVFTDVSAGPRRFSRFGPPPEAAVADTLDAGMPPTARDGAEPTTPLPPPEPAWLELFDDVASGPFRFTRGRAAPPASPDTAQDTLTGAAPADTAPPAPAGPQPRRPIGTPVPPGG
jgi:hypothetical protein